MSLTVSHQPSSPEAAAASKRSAALLAVGAAAVITALKFAVGAATGSLGILSEALDSALDLLAAVMAFFAVRLADRPADTTHQFGHGKVENFFAFLQTGLLLATSLWIVWEAVRRLTVRSVEVEPTAAAFVVMLGSIAANRWLAARLHGAALRHGSQALEASALRFRTDVWSSGVVVLGLVAVLLARRLDLPWLTAADPIAGLLVAGSILYMGSKLGRRTIDALLDAAPPGVGANVVQAVEAVPGVLSVERSRVRHAGNRYFVDLAVSLQRNVTFQRSEQVAADVVQAVHGLLPHADVVVHSVPKAGAEESIFDRVRAVAARHNFSVHDVSVQKLDGTLHVEQHLELDEKLSLKQAHDEVTRLEGQILQEVPEVAAILTHIESEPGTIEPGAELRLDSEGRELEHKLRRILADFDEVLDVHDLAVRRVRDRLYLSCHCTFADDMPLARVHELQTELEIRLKQEVPELFRVLIHPEPRTDNTR